MNNLILTLIAIAFYLLATTLLGVRMRQGTEGKSQPKLPILSLILGGLIVHGTLAYNATFLLTGLNLGFFNSMSLVAWLITAIMLLAASTKPIENIGLVLLPLAAISLSLNALYPGSQALLENASWELKAHVLISIAAYAILSISAVQAILLAIQDRHLRNRQLGGFVRAMPPLQIMESLLFQLIGVGFVFLSIALLSGAIFLDDIFAQHLVHKTLLSVLAWVLFAVLLYGRWKFGWRSRTAIRWTLSGFALLMLAYFGSKFVLELVLTR